ncbi:ABC transporter permease [Nocardia sp. NEAU-G5]|uniref:ABC transporter permease n=1 Tax=Nocardia albiluteola TaxID=2842303 RepID=A0ABS6B4S9_9NOCA|nr:ABC transporter permease [Nocardia albiluteola]MBU3065317.1 ABC transporter permease [Nocardia albiluteola]
MSTAPNAQREDAGAASGTAAEEVSDAQGGGETVTEVTVAVPISSGGRGSALRHVRGNPLGMVGAALLLIVIVTGVFAPLLAPYPPAEVHFPIPFQKPGTVGYALGTDDLGRDILSRLLYGTRASLEVGALSVLCAVVIGVPLGLLAGYWRWLDAVLSRLVDVLLAFPFVMIAVGLTVIYGAGLTQAAIALGIAQVPLMMRVVRAETLRLRETDFVLAARTMHVGPLRILGEHILPNALGPIIVQATVIMPTAVLGEALLSFLGLGIKPPAPSLGIMLSDAQQYLMRTPWPGVFPGVALLLICLGFNLFGDALRDAIDPKTSR